MARAMVKTQANRVTALDQWNDLLLAARAQAVHDLALLCGVDNEAELRRAYLEGSLAIRGCECGRCASCSVRDGTGTLLAVKRPETYEEVVDVMQDISDIFAGKDSSRGMVSVVEQPSTENRDRPAPVAFSAERIAVMTMTGSKIQMLIMVASSLDDRMSDPVGISDKVRSEVEDILHRMGGKKR